MEILKGVIKDINANGQMTIVAQYDNVDRFIKRQYKEVQVGLNDGRTISVEQRNLIHALIGSVAEWAGDLPEGMKNVLKIKFLTEQHSGLEKKMFSLSNCDITLAHEFSKYLISFVLDWGVSLSFDLFEFLNKDNELISYYVYACLKHKKCTICGEKAEVHHTPALGMGADRTEVIHEGMTAEALCRKHHSECHQIGQKEFDKRYHLNGGVVLTKELCKIWKLKKEK